MIIGEAIVPYKKRTRNLFDPASKTPYSLSRSKLENFLRCPRCFYLDRRLGIGQPSTPPFTLNIAVDELLKREFDYFRELKKPHPLMVEHRVNAVPFFHPDLPKWRNNFTGIQVHHQPTHFLFFGAIDDVWITPQEELIIVDYKATAKDGEVTLDDEWKQAYKRQMEIYQWLFRQNGFSVFPIGYFVYANANKEKPTFGGKMEFTIQLLSHAGEDSWVEKALIDAHACLLHANLPEPSSSCEYCAYRRESRSVE